MAETEGETTWVPALLHFQGGQTVRGGVPAGPWGWAGPPAAGGVRVNGAPAVPAAVVPVGVDGGMPLAVQLISGRFREELCLDAAELLEGSLGVLTPIDPRPGF